MRRFLNGNVSKSIDGRSRHILDHRCRVCCDEHVMMELERLRERAFFVFSYKCTGEDAVNEKCLPVSDINDSIGAGICDLHRDKCSLRSKICARELNICSLQSKICGLQRNLCSLQPKICAHQRSLWPPQSEICSLHLKICSHQPKI